VISFARSFCVSSVLIAMAALLPAPRAFADNLVVNGGFEDSIPYPGQGSNIWIPNDWTLSDPDPGYTAVECGANTAHTGRCAAYFSDVSQTGSFTQTLDTTPGTSYVLSFYLEIIGGPNQFTVDWGGAQILDLTNAADEGYTLYTIDVSATSASTDLSFSGLNVPGVSYIDDVSVETVGATPEPGTFALLGTGLLSCVGLVRRRLRA
jgi:PEP-CTERM motif